MIKILHGENIVESRRALIQSVEEAKKVGIEVITFQGEKLILAEIRSALGADSLLGTNRLVIIENLLSSRKSQEKTKILDYLKKGSFENDLILWEGKEVKGLEPLAKAKTEIFKISPLIFRFLENLRPGNSSVMLQLLTEVKQKEEPEMIFYMLIRQIRLLILAKDQSLSGLPDWQRRKLLNQAQNFSFEQLKEFYKELLKIDFHQKTGGDAYSLSSRLDLLVANL